MEGLPVTQAQARSARPLEQAIRIARNHSDHYADSLDVRRE